MHTQVTNLVEQALLERMRSKQSFTALDISNALKADRYPIRHGEVAAAVRDIYQSGAMGYYDYDRRLIDVTADGGDKKTQAFLYLHTETREREYTARSQAALPLVSKDQARDLSDSAAASPLPILSRPAGRTRRQKTPRTVQGRQDGALTIPRALVERLGWSEGMSLALHCENGKLKITPRPPSLGEPVAAVTVWGGGRVRVCKTKLRLGTLTAAQITVEIDGDGLRLAARPSGE